MYAVAVAVAALTLSFPDMDGDSEAGVWCSELNRAEPISDVTFTCVVVSVEETLMSLAKSTM